MKLTIPELALVVLIGPSSSGKSTFAKKHFKQTEILSSDYCRGLISDDENDLTVTKEAFEVLLFISAKRLENGKLTVVDATNVQPEARKPLINLARQFHCIPVALVFDIGEKVCQSRSRERKDRDFGTHVIRQQNQQMQRSINHLNKEGFRHVHILRSEEDIDSAVIERQKLWNNLKHEHGPFDIIGDIHGCFDELEKLLKDLGYKKNEIIDSSGQHEYNIVHPEGRKVIFLGDIVDRGPKIKEVLNLVMSMVKSNAAFCVPGNHDIRLLQKLNGKNVQLTHGLDKSVEQLEKESTEHIRRVKDFIYGLVSHYVLDAGKLVVAHAGMREEMQGRGSGKVRDFALYGETTGETDEFGLPVRCNWAAEYRGKATVVYGHTPVPEPEWLNHTVNIDTGCVFGGCLTALRYPEKELVSVSALETYCVPVKSFLDTDQQKVISLQQQYDDVLDMEDVLGKRIINPRLQSSVTIREENAIAAIEVMSRFAANPKWLIYLPPTMSPCETSSRAEYLEYPEEAFAYYRNQQMEKVVCEEKHMGSRTVVVVCRDENVACDRFGVTDEGIGICYSRTGRRFFNDMDLENKLLLRVRDSLEKSQFWKKHETEWVCLDCELMPWSAKAMALLKEQYAAVGVSSKEALAETINTLENAVANGVDTAELLKQYKSRAEMVNQYIQAYRRYCWPVSSIDDVKLAPFHMLATEGTVHIDKNHVWHMETLAEICREDEGLLLVTPYKVIELNNDDNVQEGINWWLELTGRGGEGMVVKPFDFVVQRKRGLIQPAVKCRGREYLRIIYGPEYAAPGNIERLRSRGLSSKRSLAIREFVLGIEALERFVRREPLRSVHECVFGVLAMESEPVDPRL